MQTVRTDDDIALKLIHDLYLHNLKSSLLHCYKFAREMALLIHCISPRSDNSLDFSNIFVDSKDVKAGSV